MVRGGITEAKIRLLDHMRNVMRLKHMSLCTEEACVSWVKRFVLFHEKRHPRRVPTVFTAEKTQAILTQLSGTPRLMAGLLYGAGLRPMECVHLRVKDVDLTCQQIMCSREMLDFIASSP